MCSPACVPCTSTLGRRIKRATLPATVDCRQRTPVATHERAAHSAQCALCSSRAGRPSRLAGCYRLLAVSVAAPVAGSLHPNRGCVVAWPANHRGDWPSPCPDRPPPALRHPLGRVAFSPRPAAPVVGELLVSRASDQEGGAACDVPSRGVPALVGTPT
jgi:hypothetical protein